MALKVLVLLLCGAAWVCEGVPTIKEVSGIEEGEAKYTPVAVAVAIAEEQGTVEEGQRDKRFHPLFPPNLHRPYYYPPDFTPEEWRAARLWEEQMSQKILGRGDSSIFTYPTIRQVPGGVVDSRPFQEYPPYPPWHYEGQYPSYPFYRSFRKPHPYYSYTGQRHLEGYCNYPYPHTHHYGMFTGPGMGQEGLGGGRGQHKVQGDRGQQEFGTSGDRDQLGFSGDRSPQGFIGQERDQGFMGGSTSQGFSSSDRGQELSQGDKGPGFSSDRGQSSFDKFPQRHQPQPNQNEQFIMSPKSGADNFPEVDHTSQAGQMGVGLSSGSHGSHPGSSSFPGQDGPDSFNVGGGDSFPTGGDYSFRTRGSGSSPNTRGSDSFKMGSGSIPFNTGDSSPFNTGTSEVSGLINLRTNIVPDSLLNTGASGEPGSFNQGSSDSGSRLFNTADDSGSSFNKGGTSSPFNLGISLSSSNIPANFGSGSPGFSNPSSNFGSAGATPGSSNFNRVTLSSSSLNLGDSQSFPSDTHNSPIGASSLGPSPGGFSGLGSNFQQRDKQNAVMVGKNIKREIDDAESPAVETLAAS